MAKRKITKLSAKFVNRQKKKRKRVNGSLDNLYN